MKLYTGTGDRGKTSLFSGERVKKSIDRIEAYGEVDELNSVIGAVISFLPAGSRDVKRELLLIQSHLLHVGAWLATTDGSHAQQQLKTLDPGEIVNVETAIDRMQGRVPKLSNFILPGGHPSAAMAHVARTVCRRAERRVITLIHQEKLQVGDDHPNAHIITFLNRLSDYLFILARYLNHSESIDDALWSG
ncbi:MAG: cob(I)yrinic acid a,c-diamide adenosyltransferase [Desulfobacteraceae bacterium]|nr:cob(I)yrinic acid a,c-diamide adenosyltransferase [Desulfobacteraceae bacterium]